MATKYANSLVRMTVGIGFAAAASIGMTTTAEAGRPYYDNGPYTEDVCYDKGRKGYASPNCRGTAAYEQGRDEFNRYGRPYDTRGPRNPRRYDRHGGRRHDDRQIHGCIGNKHLRICF